MEDNFAETQENFYYGNANEDEDENEDDDEMDDANLFGDEEEIERNETRKTVEEEEWNGKSSNEEEKEEEIRDAESEREIENDNEEENVAYTPSRAQLPTENAEILPQRFPDNQNNDIFIIRFPPNVPFIPTAFDEKKEIAHKANTPAHAFRWRFCMDENGEVIRKENGELLRESNTNLVEWTDGSFSLFVGEIFFECQARNDDTYVFEDTLDEIKPLHAVVSKCFQTRSVNYLPNNKGPSGLKGSRLRAANRQKTQLTSIEEALENERIVNQVLENRKEADKLRRKHRNATNNKGLTRNFLEESEDEGNITKIKETFRMAKRR